MKLTGLTILLAFSSLQFSKIAYANAALFPEKNLLNVPAPDRRKKFTFLWDCVAQNAIAFDFSSAKVAGTSNGHV